MSFNFHILFQVSRASCTQRSGAWRSVRNSSADQHKHTKSLTKNQAFPKKRETRTDAKRLLAVRCNLRVIFVLIFSAVSSTESDFSVQFGFTFLFSVAKCFQLTVRFSRFCFSIAKWIQRLVRFSTFCYFQHLVFQYLVFQRKVISTFSSVL